MNKFKRNFCFVLLVFPSTSLNADQRILTPILEIGTNYSEDEWGSKISIGLEFDSSISGYLDYQERDKGEYLSLTLERQIPFDDALSLVGTAGSTIWLNDKNTTSVVFEPIIEVGLRYDWSRYIATSLSYHYVFSGESSLLLEPSVRFNFVFKAFNHPSNYVIPKVSIASPPKVLKTVTSSCDTGLFIRSFYFSRNSAITDIKPQDITKLQLNGNETITLIGHTDITGQTEYNQKLGLKRADFVKQALVNEGIGSLSMSVCSKGEKDAESQKEGHIEDWMFRRVDVYLNE